MIFALIDNGSLESAAHENLRAVAAALSQRTGYLVHAVSWKHSDRIPAAKEESRGTEPAAPASRRNWTLAPFMRAHAAGGHREFVFLPFFISPQGAIDSALRNDLEQLQHELGFTFSFTQGLAEEGALVPIVAARIRETVAAHTAGDGQRPPVIVVDHGGPSLRSALLRDQIAAQVAEELGAEIALLVAASMEGAHGPLLAEVLRAPDFAGRESIVAPLFLSPGRHAGPEGDLAQICAAAGAVCHFTALVGTHPLAVDALARALLTRVSQLHCPTFA